MKHNKHKAEGHRRRLQQKFLKSGLKGFHDYEIVELLLTLGTPRKDCKEHAKAAMKKFKTLRGVLEATPEELQEIKGIGPHSVFGLKFAQEVARKFLKGKLLKREILVSAQDVFDYLYHSMRDLKVEVFKTIFLDGQNRVIEVEDICRGSLTSSSIYPRDVLKAAIKHNAAALVFVHNHPSGKAEPSAGDKKLTRDLMLACRAADMKVHDHIIIGDNRYYSFADEGIIDVYEKSLKGE